MEEASTRHREIHHGMAPATVAGASTKKSPDSTNASVRLMLPIRGRYHLFMTGVVLSTSS